MNRQYCLALAAVLVPPLLVFTYQQTVDAPSDKEAIHTPNPPPDSPPIPQNQHIEARATPVEDWPQLAPPTVQRPLVMGTLGAEWEPVEETSIDGTISGSIKKGTVFKTAAGDFYEVTDYVYTYEYEYRPKVLIFRKGSSYKLIINGVSEELVCRKLNSGTMSTSRVPAQALPAVIESTITSEFDGFKRGNIYRLANGQIWEQTEVYIWAWVWIRPTVVIYQSGGMPRMKVEQIEHPIAVRRIK